MRLAGQQVIAEFDSPLVAIRCTRALPDGRQVIPYGGQHVAQRLQPESEVGLSGVESHVAREQAVHHVGELGDVIPQCETRA